uniref:Uncharacterized protein n=1 Tax=Mycena chlorophos TaxID=658473 RepID=A0ABQ0LEM9_MYCCL|nr:predicted protein [Mycena chlorophos]
MHRPIRHTNYTLARAHLGNFVVGPVAVPIRQFRLMSTNLDHDASDGVHIAKSGSTASSDLKTTAATHLVPSLARAYGSCPEGGWNRDVQGRLGWTCAAARAD